MTRMILAMSLLASAVSLPAQGLPPLIDRELLFGNPEIAGAQISPDGKYLAFLKPWNSTLQKGRGAVQRGAAIDYRSQAARGRLRVDVGQQVRGVRERQ